MRDRESLLPPRRVKAEMVDERWFDIDQEKLVAWFGDSIPEDLTAYIQRHLWDGDGFPEWCVERYNDRDYGSEITVYDMCEKHDRIKDTSSYNARHTAACGTCWLEAYQADLKRRESANV